MFFGAGPTPSRRYRNAHHTPTTPIPDAPGTPTSPSACEWNANEPAANGVIHGSGHRVSGSLIIYGHRVSTRWGGTGTRVIFPMGIAAWMGGANVTGDSTSGQKSPFAINVGPVGAGSVPWIPHCIGRAIGGMPLPWVYHYPEIACSQWGETRTGMRHGTPRLTPPWISIRLSA